MLNNLLRQRSKRAPLTICSVVLVALLSLIAMPLAVGQYTPSAISSSEVNADPYRYTGFLNIQGFARGSGVVAKNPNVVLTCAHNVHDDNGWMSSATPWYWRVAYHSTSWPSGGQELRNYKVFASYSSTRQANSIPGDNRFPPIVFQKDFAVFYSPAATAGGGYAGWFENGFGQLLGGAPKMITGYPAQNISASNLYRMHRTGPFYSAFSGIGTGRLTIC